MEYTTSKKISILGVEVDSLTMQETIDVVEKYMQHNEFLHLVGVNADKINQMARDKTLARIVTRCDIINADGASLVLASRFLNTPLPERVAGIDLMLNLVNLSASKKYPVYLLGAKEEVLQRAANNLSLQYPNLEICGMQNGYFTDSDLKDVAEKIRVAGPSIVFVGISSPKKELLIDYFETERLSSVFMGVGGSFDVIAGEVSRAPQWVQKVNMEWLYRMVQEPRRLFSRYFFGNFEFLTRLVFEKAHADLPAPLETRWLKPRRS